MHDGESQRAVRVGPGASHSRSARARKLLISIALLLLCVGTFERVRSHDFADLDDLGGIQHNPDLAPVTLSASLRNAFMRPLLSNWIPVTALSHQLDRKLFASRASGHLLTNLALHTAASILLFWALSALTGALGRSAFVAALFAVHPLHVETVAWVSERKGVLSGVFFALTLLAYAGYARSPRLGRYLAVLAALLLALLSKPTAVTLPCVLLLLDYWPLCRLDRRAWLEKLPMFALVAGASVVTFVVQRNTGAMAYGGELPVHLRLANALAAYGFYLEKVFWPTDLAAFYTYPADGPGAARVARGLAALLLGTLGTFWLRATRPYLLVGWLWFVGMLVPMLGLVQVGEQPYADRYMYLPLIGLSIALTWAFADLVRSAFARRVAAGAVIAALAVAAWQQVGHWRDGRALWLRVLDVNPGNTRALIGLGSFHARRFEFAEAERIFLALHSDGATAEDRERARGVLVSYFVTKASHLRKRGDAAGALASVQQASVYAPGDLAVERSMGLALAGARRSEATPYLERALRARPADLEVLAALASLAEASGARAEAIRLRREIRRLAPDAAANANDLAWLLATAPEPELRNPAEAIELALALVDARANPSPNLLDTLAASYAAAGRFDDAAATTARALAKLGERGDTALGQSIRERDALYRAGKPFLEARQD